MPIFGGSMAEYPTISIAPIEGKEFTKRLLTPFQETKFILLQRQRIEPHSRIIAATAAPKRQRADEFRNTMMDCKTRSIPIWDSES